MKRPIAELQTMTVQASAEAAWLHDEQESWQILRRKPGYVTHFLYQAVDDRLQRLVYSEWESKKALDGARHLFQSTPLARRARNALAAPPERLVVELLGPVTSTKGLDLPETAIALAVVARLRPDAVGVSDHPMTLSNAMAGKPGHITHVVFRGFGRPAVIGALSYWQDSAALEQGVATLNGLPPSEALEALSQVRYQVVRS